MSYTQQMLADDDDRYKKGLNEAFNKEERLKQKAMVEADKEAAVENELNRAFNEKVKQKNMEIRVKKLEKAINGETVDDICFLDEHRFVSVHDKNIKLWYIQREEENIPYSVFQQMYSGHTENVQVLCALDKDHFVSGSLDHTLKLWNWKHSTAVRTYKQPGMKGVCALNNGKYFVSGNHFGHLTLWNVEQVNPVRKIGQDPKLISMCAINNNQFVTCSEIGNLMLWDIDFTKQVDTKIRTFVHRKGKGVTAVCRLDDKNFVSASSDKTLKLWNVNNPDAVQMYEGHTNDVTGVCRLNDYHFVSCSRYDGTLKIWNVDQSTPLLSIEQETRALKSYNDTLVTADNNGIISMYQYTFHFNSSGGALHNENVGKGGKRRNRKSKKLNKRSVKRKFRKTRRKSRKSRK